MTERACNSPLPHSEKRVRGSGDDSQTASDGMVFLEELLKVGALDLLEHFLEGHPLDEGQIHIGDLLAVTQFDRCIDQAADIIGAAPDLGHAAVDVEQG